MGESATGGKDVEGEKGERLFNIGEEPKNTSEFNTPNIHVPSMFDFQLT